MNAKEILLMKMANLSFVDKKPFCFEDFKFFEYEGQQYTFKHGTIRNTFSKLKKEGEIELVYRSGPAFYKIKGSNVGKPMTYNHTVGADRLTPKQRTFLQCLQSIPMDKPAIHNIRLSFTYKHLWSILSANASPLIKNKDMKNNKDITMQTIDLGDLEIKTTIHNTNTVSVIVGCSMTPISIDVLGLARLTSSLARVEDRLQLLVNGHNTAMSQSGKQQHLSLILNSKIPGYMNWTVKMWHFGRDGHTGYSGKQFEITWEEGLSAFHHHIYSKEYEGKRGKKKIMKVRDEVQEYPNKSLEEAFTDKLKEGDNTFSVGI